MATTITANGINFPDGSASAPSIGGTDTNTGLFTGSDIVGFATGGVERIKIASNGNVSIGNNPTVHVDTIFHIEDSGETNIKIEGSTSTLGARISLQNNDTTANSFSQYAFNDAGGQSTSAIQGINTDQTNNYGEMAFLTRNAQGLPPSERVRIDKDGNVGIGTSSPGYKLEVVDSGGALLKLNISHEGTYDLRFVYQNSEANIWSYGSTDLTFGTRYNKKLHLVTNGPSKRLTIDGSGNVGIGTTSPAAKLDVHGGVAISSNSVAVSPSGYDLKIRSNTSKLGIHCDAGSGTPILEFGTGGSTGCFITNLDNTPMRFGTQNTERMRIQGDGKIGIGTTSPNRILSVKGNGGQMSIVDDDDSKMQFYCNSGTGSIWATGGGGTDGSLDFATTPNGGSTVSRLIIRKGGETHFTRQAQGGAEHVGNTPNQWFKIGTWSGPSVDGAARAKITVFGTDTHNSGANVAGETIIYFGFGADNVCRGNYHSFTAGYSGLIGVAHKYDSTAKSVEIWVRYEGGYGMTQCFADVSTGFFSGTSTATGSTSVPAGATELGSDYRLLTSDGTHSQTTFSVSGSTKNVYIGKGDLGFSTAGKGITLGNTSVGTAANTLDSYEEGTWIPTYNFSGGTGTFTYSIQTGRYTKIGNRVLYTMVIRSTGHSGTSTGNVRVAGLPYAVKNDSPSGGSVFFITGGNFTSDYGVATQLNTAEQIEFYRQMQSTANNYNSPTTSNVNKAGLFIKVEGTYYTEG